MGGHARVVIDAVRREGFHEIAGLINQDGSAAIVDGVQVVGSNEDFMTRVGELSVTGAVVALGDNAVRDSLFPKIEAHLELITIRHPFTAIAAGTEIGAGTVILAGAVINPGTRIGKGSIVNTRSSVDHDCRVGDFVHLCPGSTVCGHVEIGNRAWIGAGSTVSDHLTIGKAAFVLVGSTVTKPVPDNARAAGNRIRLGV